MLSKNTMTGVIESKDETIERQANEIYELKAEVGILKNVNNTLLSRKDYLENKLNELQEKQDKMESILDGLGIKDNFDDFINFIKFIYEYKDEFKEFINLKKNNIKYDIEKDDKYISLKNINIINGKKILELESKIGMLNSNIEDNFLFKQLKDQNKLLSEEIKNLKTNKDSNLNIDMKIKEALDKQNLDFNIKIDEINKSHIREINQIKSEYEKSKTSLPSPSSSSETKKEKNKRSTKKDKINNEKLLLPDNLFEVIYYRNINNNKFLPNYFIKNEKSYLSCCGNHWEHNELTMDNGVTCLKCYKTYLLNNEKKLIKNILPEHIIHNEKDLLLKLKCNNKQCNYISKKEIDLCYKCKNIDLCEIIEYEIPNKDEDGYETKLAMAAKCYFNIEYISNIFDKAYKEGLVKNDFKELVEYVKKNKIIDEKQKNVIINKIVRCHDIYDIYNLDKYNLIHDYMKRLEFSLKAISKLDESSFRIFKNELIEKLDIYIDKNNIKNDAINTNKDEDKTINENSNIGDIDIEKAKKILNKDYIYKNPKGDNICIILGCNKKRAEMFGNIIDFCNEHARNSFTFDFQLNQS